MTDNRGFYYWLNEYLQHCPEAVVEGNAPLFQHPTKKVDVRVVNDAIWYSLKRAVGARHFEKILKSAYAKAGIKGDFTFRSLRSSDVKELNKRRLTSYKVMNRTFV